MSDGNGNVTFSAFFKLTMLMLTGLTIFVTTIIPAKYGENGLILSHILMLCMAFAYVIVLYVVYSDSVDVWTYCTEDKEKTGKNPAIALIYVIRMAIRTGIVVYIVSELSRELVLKKYPVMLIAISVIVAIAYMGSRGMGGVRRFAEAVFWFTLISAAIVFAASLKNIDIDQLSGYLHIYEEQGINVTINRIMTRGGLMFLGFSSMEFVMVEYLQIKNRRRRMLLGAVGTASIIGTIGSVIVTTTLGMKDLSMGRKEILYIVGALELPNGIKIRPLILVCYLMVVWGIAAAIPNVACACEVVDEYVHMKNRKIVKLVWILAVFGVTAWITFILSREKASHFIPGYMILVDIPLSLILPAVALMKKKFVRVTCLVILCLVIPSMLSSCAYKPIENVDYANVIVAEKGSEYPDKIRYTMIITELDDDSEAVTKENRYTQDADNFKKLCRGYDESHVRTIDTSHVEYIVVQDEEVLDLVYTELEHRFSTSYVTVIVENDLWDRLPDDNTKEYLKTHYKGRCLATIKEE